MEEYLNYSLLSHRKIIKERYNLDDVIDICIVTYNRLIYLKKCINSIIASTSFKYRINVIDDSSNDGTKEWLLEMKNRGLIHNIILNKENIGTANNFNNIIKSTKSKHFVMANDDMYFHRYWDYAVLDIITKYDDCGIVSFYDYTRYNVDEGVKKINDVTLKVPRTGLGACIINRDSFNTSGGFILPEGSKMGYFATPFCVRFSQTNHSKNKHYATVPNYAIHMDITACKLNEIESLKTYGDMRKIEKKGWGK
jgi:glycosyltransferase involved in cell wall biosynthesis